MIAGYPYVKCNLVAPKLSGKSNWYAHNVPTVCIYKDLFVYVCLLYLLASAQIVGNLWTTLVAFVLSQPCNECCADQMLPTTALIVSTGQQPCVLAAQTLELSMGTPSKGCLLQC